MLPEKLQRHKIDKITAIELPSRTRSQRVREALARENYNPEQVVSENIEILNKLSETPFRVIGQKLSKGEPFTFDEAFLGMTYVIAATNRGIFEQIQPQLQKAHGFIKVEQLELKAPAQTFLTAMAQRETHGRLTEEEVAGMVAAEMMDINLRLGFKSYVLETAGMGGDRGFVGNGEKKKVINASTLSAIVLSSMGIPVIKNGSYANTSVVGSTETIEALGVNIYQSSLEEITKVIDDTNFYFSDAHVAKTIHDLSHGIGYETINHIIGPMTPPIDRKTRLNKVIGVNDGVHPSLIAKAYEILHQKGYHNVGNVLVVAGLDQEPIDGVDIEDRKAIKSHMILDEVSPYKTLLSVVRNGKYTGSFMVEPQDFGVSIDPNGIQIVNIKQELLAANQEALTGPNRINSDYLAINSAIGLFAAEYLDKEDSIVENSLNSKYLRECFVRCKEAIVSGKAAAHLDKIVAVSNVRKNKNEIEERSIFDEIDVVIFDIDNTLVRPRDPRFYRQYTEAVNKAVSKRLGISLEEGKRIADYYRQHFGGGENALFAGNLHEHFPEHGIVKPDYSLLYDKMCEIDPTGQFDRHDQVLEYIKTLREQGKKVVALTDSPFDLSQRMLFEAGIDPEKDFDLYLAYEKEKGPHKIVRSQEVFSEIAAYFGVPHQRVLSIGDNYTSDIMPADRLGMKTCLVNEEANEGYKGYRVNTLHDVFTRKVQIS